jgi:formamidopyrimidine-DNA glycosylase
VPELPEVETVVRAIRPRVEGRRILNAEIYSRQVLRHCAFKTPRFLLGKRVERVERRGKFIVLRLDRGYLVIHLGMTGQILFDTPRTTHTRAIFTLEDSAMMYEDSRMFGTIEWNDELSARVGRLGPEPFDISPGEFFEALHRRRGPIKPLLLNQSVVRGIGNIYADESLFRARIHPRTKANRIRKPRALRLHEEIGNVLVEAIENRGSSVSDYRDPEGRKGEFQQFHRVYGREGEPCLACGTAIRRIVLGGRSTHYCPRCQR